MEQNNQQQQFKCSGDCLNCRKLPNERREQWQYCASQFTFNSMCMIEKMQESLGKMQCTIDELRLKIDAIQNSEASVFDPTADFAVQQQQTENPENTEKPIAQEGSGV